MTPSCSCRVCPGDSTRSLASGFTDCNRMRCPDHVRRVHLKSQSRTSLLSASSKTCSRSGIWAGSDQMIASSHRWNSLCVPDREKSVAESVNVGVLSSRRAITFPNGKNASVSQQGPARHEAEIPGTVTKTPKNTIGQFVRERRKAAEMTQRELGELAGVGTRFVSDLERDKPTVRMDAVNKVLAVFGKCLGPIDAPRQGDQI